MKIKYRSQLTFDVRIRGMIIMIEFVIFTLLVYGSNGEEKQWKTTFSYSNPENWENYLTPSTKDIAVFPEEMNVPLLFPELMNGLCGISLPGEGDIYIPIEFSLKFSTSYSYSTCGQERKFKERDKGYWVDPDNWTSNATNDATPHIERIPCSNDVAVFPEKNSFGVIFPEQAITVSGLRIGNENVTESDLIQTSGQLGSFSITDLVLFSITGSKCEIPSGCTCGTETFQEEICAMKIPFCPVPHCFSPVKPIGHCCHICASYFVIGYKKDKFNFENFKQKANSILRSAIQKSNAALDVYISLTSSDQDNLQIVMKEKLYSDTNKEIANDFHQVLLSSLSKEFNLGSIVLYTAGIPFDPESWFTTFNIAIFTLISVIAILAILLFFAYNQKIIILNTPTESAFTFVRFENVANEVSINCEPERPLRRRSFKNPMFEVNQEVKVADEDYSKARFSDLQQNGVNETGEEITELVQISTESSENVN